MAMDYLWLSDKLQGDYKEVFEKAEIFIGVKNITGDEADEMMMDLLDLLLSAQNAGKPVQKIVGTDTGTFCADFFSGYTMKKQIKNIPRQIYRCMMFVFIFELASLLILWTEKDINLLTAKTDVTGYLIGIMTAWFIQIFSSALIRPFMFRWKWLTSGVYYGIVLFLSLGVVAGGIMLSGFWMKSFELPAFPVVLISGGYVAVYRIVGAGINYRRYGKICKPKDPCSKLNFMNVMEDEMPDDLVKRFYKINEKRLKQGSSPMTEKEYMEYLRKKGRQEHLGNWIGVVAVAAVVLGLILHTALTSTWIDTFIFVVVVMVAEIPAFLLFRVGMRSAAVRQKLLDECDRRGLTILEYVEGEMKDETVHDSLRPRDN